MLAGYDYMLVRNQLQHRLLRTIGLFLFFLGVSMVATGGAYYAYAAKARAGLDEWNVTASEEIVNEPNIALATPYNGELANNRQPTLAESADDTSIDPWVDSAANQESLPLAEEFPPLHIPASAIARQQLYPGESLQANSWSDPLVYEPPSYVQQALLRKFTPLNLSQASPVGSLAAPIRIRLPAIGVDSRVTQLGILDLGDSRVYATPDKTVGHIPESANLGEAASSWFFGHLDSPIMREGAVFRDLPKIPGLLRSGQEIYIIADNGANQYLYKVTSTQVVHQNNMRLYDTGQATIHLVTCVPTLVYDHRLIVTGQLVGIK